MARILVVDDVELERLVIRNILESAGHVVVEAENGVAAIAAQEADPFDLVITDIVMPKKEGVETIIELKRAYPALKIIAVSSGGSRKNPDYLKLAQKFGADKILSKPISMVELLDQVNACLSDTSTELC